VNDTRCQDFYDFACGNFENVGSVNSFRVIRKQMMEHLRLLVEAEIPSDEIAPYKMVKDLHQSCLNTEMIDQIGRTGIEAIHTELGGWPVVVGATWNAETFFWHSQVAALRNRGYSVDYLFSSDVSTDDKDNTRNIIEVS